MRLKNCVNGLLLPLLTIEVLCNGGLSASESKPAAMVAAPAQSARLQWWREARLGLFIHWGPVSLKGTEIGWSRGRQVPIEEYDQLYQRFNPVDFNAEQWAKIAKMAGMKYVVLTTKHHDGFCLWDTKYSDYNIMNTPFHRDVTKEVAAACRRQGIVFCIYHSICDWRHPDYPLGSPGGKTPKPSPNMDRYNQYLKNQLGELITDYGPLGLIWFDGEWETPWVAERGDDLYLFCRGLQDSVIINNRVSKGRKRGAGTTAQTLANPGDYDTPEQRIGGFQTDRPWESCITICEQWAWKPQDQLKSLKECLRALVTCAGGDGNLLLNVGPMPNGQIEPRQVERLQEIGAWLKRYGKTIYKTRGGPFKPGNWGASTRQGRSIYLHVFQWPDQGLELPPISRSIRSCKVLTGGKASLKQTDKGILLTLPPERRQEIDTLIELKLDDSAMELAPFEVAARTK